MNYFDKNGNQIKAGMDIRMADGSFERVYETTDAYGNPDLGINASNEEYLERHPYNNLKGGTDSLAWYSNVKNF